MHSVLRANWLLHYFFNNIIDFFINLIDFFIYINLINFFINLNLFFSNKNIEKKHRRLFQFSNYLYITYFCKFWNLNLCYKKYKKS